MPKQIGIIDRLKRSGASRLPAKKKEPLWKGPEAEGITQSLLWRFLDCRERFRIRTIEGLAPPERFYAPIDFGNMWHAAEEAHAARKPWEPVLKAYAQQLCIKYKFQQPEINDWYEKGKALFPLYIDHWQHHPDVKNRTPAFQEHKFKVPYRLPSGRTVILLGKIDAGDLIAYPNERPGLFIQENKTKSSIDQNKITRQLKFDLQTMMYHIGMSCDAELRDALVNKLKGDYPILGIRYNVIRRSSHKSIESMLKKLEEDRSNNRIGEWFSRWKVKLTPNDVDKFKRTCFNPILENLCWWYDEVSGRGHYSDVGSGALFDVPPATWRTPFGGYNVIHEGGSSDYDEYLDTGSEVGLRRNVPLFAEL